MAKKIIIAALIIGGIFGGFFLDKIMDNFNNKKENISTQTELESNDKTLKEETTVGKSFSKVINFQLSEDILTPSLVKAVINEKKYTFSINRVIELTFHGKDEIPVSWFFELEGYLSLSDGSKSFTTYDDDYNLIVKFEKQKAKEKKIHITFSSEPILSNIEVFTNDKLQGKTDENGKYIYSKVFPIESNEELSFSLKHADYDLDYPLDFQGKSLINNKKTVVIKPLIRNNFEYSYQFVNIADNTPLADIQFVTKNEKKYKSDSDGKIIIKIERPVLGFKMGGNIKNKNISSSQELKDIILDNMSKPVEFIKVQCKTVYFAEIIVKDNRGKDINRAELTVNGKRSGFTNNEGKAHVKFSRLGETIKLKISKSLYIDSELEFTPTSKIEKIDIVLQISTGVITVIDSLSKVPVQYVDVILNKKVIAQTTDQGQATFPIALGKEYQFKLRPSTEAYINKTTSLNFKHQNDRKIIKLKPRPKKFILLMQTDSSIPIKDVQVAYKRRLYNSDSRGIVIIENDNPTFPVEMRISYGLFSQNLRIVEEVDTYTYERIVSIASSITVTFTSSGFLAEESKAYIKVSNNLGNIVKEGRAPLNATLEPGLYKVIAETNDRSVEKQIQIRQADQTVNIDMSDPLAMLKQYFSARDYQRVKDLFEQQYSDIITREYSQDNNKAGFCELTKILGITYGNLNDNIKAAKYMEMQVNNDCIAENPNFYYNLALILYRKGEYERSVKYFNEAYMAKSYFSDQVRAKKAGDCKYYSANAMYQHYVINFLQSNIGSASSRCSILGLASDYLDEFIFIADENLLDYKQTESLKNKLFNAKIDEGCQ